MNKIKWWRVASWLRNIIGRYNFTILQSWLKYWQRFHNDYHYGGKHTAFTKQTYVFMIDGRTKHGGLSDRLRGVFSLYEFCKDQGNDFKICWTSPFKLHDYFLPSSVDWMVNKDQLSYNLNDTEFKFFNSYTGLDDQKDLYYKLLESKKPEVHVYSNVSIDENRYSEYFSDLFVPSLVLKKVMESCTKEIGGNYISITFRFIGLLEDFNDDVRWLKKENGMDSSFYVRKGLAYIEKKHIEYQEFKILVTSDSKLFLQEAKKLPYVYIIPGDIKHMDYNDEDDQLSQLKTFGDFLMVSKAEKCFAYSTGNMFRTSQFAKTAALIGGRNYYAVHE